MYIYKRDLFYRVRKYLRGGVEPEPTEEQEKKKTQQQYEEYKSLLRVAQTVLRRSQIDLWIMSARAPSGDQVYGSPTWKEVCP